MAEWLKPNTEYQKHGSTIFFLPLALYATENNILIKQNHIFLPCKKKDNTPTKDSSCFI